MMRKPSCSVKLLEGLLERFSRSTFASVKGKGDFSTAATFSKYGVNYTYFLLEGLRGKADTDRDGLITVDEAYRYVSKHVPQATGQEQNPVKKGAVRGRLILGIAN